MNSQKTALILGANGGVGVATAEALHKRGWRIRAFSRRKNARAHGDPRFEWFEGDAMDASAVLAAAQGADMIFHGVNPPGYRNWPRVVLPMLDNTIAAAKSTGAHVAFPGTLYNFGPEAGALIGPDAKPCPVSKKGEIRVEMERRLEAHAQDGGRVLILRAGDFFGANTNNSWFSQALVKPGRPLSSVAYPGDRDVGHAWAYLPDVGEAFARLLTRTAVAERFERHCFEALCRAIRCFAMECVCLR